MAARSSALGGPGPVYSARRAEAVRARAAQTAGASGFLLKDVSPEHLVAAVRLVRCGDALLAPSITRRLVERFAPRSAGAGGR